MIMLRYKGHGMIFIAIYICEKGYNVCEIRTVGVF